MTSSSAVATVLLATTMLAAPAFAADSTAKQIQQLQEQLRTLQQQLDSLRASEAADRAALDKQQAERQAEMKQKMEAEAAAREIAIKNGAKTVIVNGKVELQPPSPGPKVAESGTHRFSLSSGDGAWTIAPTGRVHLDVGGYVSFKPDSPTVGVGNPATGYLSSGFNARRARVGVTGKAMNDFGYSLVIDAGGAQDNGGTSIQTAQIQYLGLKNTIIELGYSDTFFTLDEATSSNDIMFMERATPAIVATAFNAGDNRSNFGFRTWGDRYWVGAYLTGPAVNDAHALSAERIGAFQRATFQLVSEPTYNVHLGGAIDELIKAPNTGPGTARTITLSDRPELRIDPTQFLSTGALGTVANPVTSGTVFNLETAAQYSSFFYQGEYFHYIVNRDGKPKASFDGGYAQVSYTIGGRRTYVANAGAYSGVNPTAPFSMSTGGLGAFEFALRYSYADLVDQYNSSIPAASQPFSVNGGRQSNVTAGMNWYLNSNMRVMVNWVHSRFKKANPTTTVAGSGIPVGNELDAIAARFQFVY